MNSNQTRLDGLAHMTADWDYLNDIAGTCLTAGSSMDAEQRLHEVTEKARIEISRRAYPCLAVTFLSMLMFAVYFFCAASKLVDFQWYEHVIHGVLGYYLVYILPTAPRLAACLVVGITSFLMLYLMQHQEPFKSWFKLPSHCYPTELEALFDELQRKEWQAKNKDGRLPTHLFSGSWRTLLAAGPEVKFTRLLVWDKSGKAYRGDIKIKHKSAESAMADLPPKIIANLSTNASTSPLLSFPHTIKTAKSITSQSRPSPHWIAKIPENQFENFLISVEEMRKGKWERADAPEKVIIVLKYARKYAVDNYSNHVKIVVKQMADSCEEHLKGQLGAGQNAFTGLSGKGKTEKQDKNSASWIELMLRNDGKHPYSWVRELALEFTDHA